MSDDRAVALWSLVVVVGCASCGPSSLPTDAPPGAETPPGLPPGPWDLGHRLEASPQAPGDPEVGEWALLNKGYVTCGIPYPLFTAARGALGGFGAGEPLPGRGGKNAEVPYRWTVHRTRSGAEIVSFNCLECHAGRFNGQLVLGLGDVESDFTEPQDGLISKLPVPNPGLAGIEELTRFIKRYQVLGPKTVMKTVGTNPADMVAVVLASHRHRQTLAWSDKPLLDVRVPVAPADVPPWWRVKKKHAMFHNGMTRGDHRGSMMFASSLCTDSVEEAREILSYFNNIAAYLRTLEAPRYPFPIDRDLAARGAPVFARACSGCHGTYGEDPAQETYPNLLFRLEHIGTDPLIAEYGDNVSPEMISWFNDSFYGRFTQLSVRSPFPGYVAPPLDGIWATAPFLHNGSVPTLEGVLNTAARPRYWKRVDYDSRNFDQRAVGWPFVATAYGHEGAPEKERKLIYDTSLGGHGNGGHAFGDSLGAEERHALLEYLKTL